MPRTAAAFTVRFRADKSQWSVRFRLDGQRIEEKIHGLTRKSERAEASRKAGEIYAAHVQGKSISRASRTVASGDSDLVELTAAWLDALATRDVTTRLYRKYAKGWLRQWGNLGELTERPLKLYVQRRLKEARGKTIRNELSALNRFLEWCQSHGHIAEIPPLPKVAIAEGASNPNRRHREAAPDLSTTEVWAIIDNLPERSDRYGFPVRARAIVAATTSLRPETLGKIRVPEHYTRGADTLRITHDIDKEGFAREIPLPQVARDALDSVCPDAGPIFGQHRLDLQARAAADKAVKQGRLSASKAGVFCFQHFRSAAITHLLERSGNLPGVQFIAGHKHGSTTSRYIRPSQRAAAEVFDVAFGGRDRGTGEKKASKS